MSQYLNPHSTQLGRRIVVERRRYGTTTYTWLSIYLVDLTTGGEELVSLGDPWPCVRPSLTDVREAIIQCEREHYSKQHAQ